MIETPAKIVELSTGAESSAAQIGEEIRQLRVAKQLTLRDLAKLSDRSLGYLSQIERGSVEPSISTLRMIADALDVDINWFFPPKIGTESNEQSVVVRAKSRRQLTHAYSFDTAALGYEDFLLSSNLNLNLCMGLSRIQPGGHTNNDQRRRNGDFCGYVVKGTVVLELNGERISLYEGDSFSFGIDRVHDVINESDSIAEVVWALSPIRLDF